MVRDRDSRENGEWNGVYSQTRIDTLRVEGKGINDTRAFLP